MKLVLLLLIYCGGFACGYNILAIFTHGALSHFRAFEPLLLELTERGHNLTLVSQHGVSDARKNYREIPVQSADMSRVEILNFHDERFKSDLSMYKTHIFIEKYIEDECSVLANPHVKHLITGNYDVVLMEDFSTDCFLGLVYKLQAPFVRLSSCELLPWAGRFNANPNNPSYIPHLFLAHSDAMDFFARVENAVLTLFDQLYYDHVMDPFSEQLARKYLGQDLPPLREISRNASLLLVNSHFALNRPRPLVPSVIQVGGIHVRSHGKITKNLERWINESGDDGVIYFSMGSMIKGHTFPEDKRRAFLRAFGRLGQRVLWKWENDTMPGKPDNVMIQKWMPQFDILCHPNVKAFISHGGLLGTTEAVHCGVPVVVMPQFGDQHTNARALEASGGGVVLNFKDLTEDSIYKALKTVLDPKFNKQAKELSERFRDRPMPPMETAIYWIEYVARHKGAHHMRTAAVGMPFYQYLLLDVIAFLSAVILTALYVIYKAVKFVAGKICGGKKKKVKKN